MNNFVFCNVTPCGSCKTDVSEERIASIIMVARIGELGTLVRRTQRASVSDSFHTDDGGDIVLRNVCSYKRHTESHPRRRHSS
jgi:hypothetical protein